MEGHKHSQKNALMVPASIVVAGLIIAAAIFFKDGSAVPANNVPQQQAAAAENLDAMDPVTNKDHIRGSIDAPVKIVEYSDTECPFCKKFHTIMKDLLKDAEVSGKVAWVYRHFPLDSIHPNARKEAEATECAADQGGNDKFWAYLDRLMEDTTPSKAGDMTKISRIAGEVGLDVKKFNECVSSGKFAAVVDAQAKDAAETGARGTPWSIIVGPDGEKLKLSGAQPVTAIKQLIELALKK